MPEKTFRYREKVSRHLGKIKRPLVDIEIYSQRLKRFLFIPEVLFDIGADITLMPEDVGKSVLENYKVGKILALQGISRHTVTAYIHRLKLQINGIAFTCPVAVADSPNVPPLLGRVEALDLFDVLFAKGQEIKISY